MKLHQLIHKMRLLLKYKDAPYIRCGGIDIGQTIKIHCKDHITCRYACCAFVQHDIRVVTDRTTASLA